MASLTARVALGASCATAVACTYYTWRVEDKRREQREIALNRRLVLGSVDDLTADRLKPGDVVIFERDCSCLHLPLAAHCVATKLLLKDSCDHVGLVFTDRATLLPHVIEAVPWQGVVASSFQSRVAQGTDERITVRPLKMPKSAPRGDAKAEASGVGIRERRVAERVNAFAHGALGSTKVPTKAQDSVGLVLNALLAAQVIDPVASLALVEPKHFLDNTMLPFKAGASFGDPLIVRSLK